MTPAHVVALLAIPAVAGLLWAKQQENLRAELVVKPICAALFLIVAFLHAADDSHYGLWIRIGLGCSFVGDVLLIGKDRRWVGPGLAAFLLAHLASLVAVWPLVDLERFGVLRIVAATVPLMLLGVVVLRSAWPKLGGLLAPVLVYFCALSAMTGAALCVWSLDPRATGPALLGLGMALFFVSDISVARYRFVERKFTTKLWGAPCYFAGQLLLAFSIGWPI